MNGWVSARIAAWIWGFWKVAVGLRVSDRLVPLELTGW
jgi:hypothetical protein